MKQLYLMRHAEAEKIEACDGDDRRRSLTKKGKKSARAVARWMSSAGLSMDLVATSPLKRAARTAAIVSRRLGGGDPLVLEELAGEASVKDLAAALIPLVEKADRVLVVGHQPQLGRLISLLISGGIYARVELEKGAVCRVCVEEYRPAKCGSMDMLVSPRLLP